MFPQVLGQQESRPQNLCLIQVCFRSGNQHILSVLCQEFHNPMIPERTFYYLPMFIPTWCQVIFHLHLHPHILSYPIHNILVPYDTVHKVTSKRHKRDENHQFSVARFSINIWNILEKLSHYTQHPFKKAVGLFLTLCSRRNLYHRFVSFILVESNPKIYIYLSVEISFLASS